MTTLWESLFFLRDCYCELNKDIAWVPRIKITLASNKLVTKHLILLDLWGTNCLNHLQQLNRNTRESCLAGKYLQSIGLKCVEQQWRSILTWKIFKHAETFLNSLGTLQTILEEHWKSICQASYWRNGVNVSHSYTLISASWSNIQGYLCKSSD